MQDDEVRDTPPFWRTKRLEEMSDPEWESLCDGCGRCCLIKLEEEDTGKIHYTSLGCKLLDSATCRCSNYAARATIVTDCIKLTPQTVQTLQWLPPTCGYRLVREGRDLMWWHPLVSGSADTVHQAGVSVRGRVHASEDDIPTEEFVDHLATWPTRVPKAARAAASGRKRVER